MATKIEKVEARDLAISEDEFNDEGEIGVLYYDSGDDLFVAVAMEVDQLKLVDVEVDELGGLDPSWPVRRAPAGTKVTITITQE